MRVLFATYDGVLAGPGRSQSVPYVRGLAARGHDMALLSFEDPERAADADAVAAVESELGGLPWTRLPWRRNPVRDLATGVRALRAAVRAHDAEFVHARGYVPAFLARTAGRAFLFDMRGFWPDERADGGLWQRGGVSYMVWKRIERTLCARAAATVVLTERARDELARLEMTPSERPVHVIPTCADLDRFHPVAAADRVPEARGAARRYVALGGTGTWYLRDEILALLAHAVRRDDDAVAHVLTGDEPEPLERSLDELGVPPERRLVQRVPHADVPRWISGARAGIVLVRPTWSKGASCPTKLAEFLGCGVPLIANSGVGDTEKIIGGAHVGAVHDDFDADGRTAALDRLDALYADGEDALRTRCRALAEDRLSLPRALDAYEAAYGDAAESLR